MARKIHLSPYPPTPWCWSYTHMLSCSVFYNSDPQIWTASTLSAEPSCHPNIYSSCGPLKIFFHHSCLFFIEKGDSFWFTVKQRVHTSYSLIQSLLACANSDVSFGCLLRHIQIWSNVLWQLQAAQVSGIHECLVKQMSFIASLPPVSVVDQTLSLAWKLLLFKEKRKNCVEGWV